MKVEVVFVEWGSGIFTYYFEEDIKNNFHGLNGCLNFQKQEFTGGTYIIMEDFEEKFLNVIMAEILVEQYNDEKAGVKKY